MKSASGTTSIEPTAFGLLMDPACLRRAVYGNDAVFANVTHEPAPHRLDWRLLQVHARALRFWVFHRAAH